MQHVAEARANFCSYVVALTLGAAACRASQPDKQPALEANASTAPASPASDGPLTTNSLEQRSISPYPKARWRLADWNDLQNVALWGAHILVRHAESNPGYVFSPTGGVSGALPTRSREEALHLAQEIAASARQAPDEFARVARERSEDVQTAAGGGVLGEKMASQFLPWPMVLDAFAALRPGEVSEVVETNFGFHIFQRLPPPPEEAVTGAHIVIAHSGAPGIARLRGTGLPQRSPEEARRIADEVFAAARANPSAFDALMSQYSDHPDAVRHGDLGTWSTREPSPLGLSLEVLRHLKVGEVAQPMETPYGYQILQRQANRPRSTYAVDAVEFSYEPAQPDTDPQSRYARCAAASVLIEDMKTQPERFRDVQHSECCAEPLVWMDGRGIPRLANAVDGLRVDELTPAPVDTGFSCFVVRRIEVPRREPVAPRFELPAPATADLSFLVRYRDTDWVREQLAQVAEEAGDLAAKLPESRRSRFMALHREENGLDERVEPAQRIAAFTAMQDAVRELLGGQDYGSYRQLLNRRFESAMLTDAF